MLFLAAVFISICENIIQSAFCIFRNVTWSHPLKKGIWWWTSISFHSWDSLMQVLLCHVNIPPPPPPKQNWEIEGKTASQHLVIIAFFTPIPPTSFPLWRPKWQEEKCCCYCLFLREIMSKINNAYRFNPNVSHKMIFQSFWMCNKASRAKLILSTKNPSNFLNCLHLN